MNGCFLKVRKGAMVLAKRRDIDMTNGPLLGKIVVFVLPLIFTNLLQTLYNAADMIAVGYSTEADAVGAIGTTGSFVSLVLNLFIGLSIGATVVVSRHIGAGEEERANVAVHTSTLVALISGTLGGLIGIAISGPIMEMMGNQGKLLALSVRYTRIYFAAMPFHSLSNCAIAIHRAKGDTKTPLMVLSLSGILNVVLNLFFVLVVGLSVEGVALATGIAAATSAAVLYGNLMRDPGACHFSFQRLHLDRNEVSMILRIGVPSAVQGGLFSVSNMLIQSSIIQVNNTMCDPNAAYQPVVKGNAAAANLEGFAYTAVNAMQQAAVTFTSQNLGAGKHERIKRVMACSYALAACIGVVMSLTLFLLQQPLLALYQVQDSATDALAHIAFESGAKRMLYVIAPYLVISTMEVGSGVMRGLGASLTSTVICLIGACALRVVWVMTVFRAVGTLESIYISYPISWALTGASLFLCILTILRKYTKQKQRAELQNT